jgi:membrane protease subunit HflC
MRSPVTGIAALIVLFVVIIVAYSSVFTVSQTEQVLVVRLGEPVRVVIEPGLNFKAPFIDTVISIDKRILDLENPSQEVIASDQKRLVVDAFARYRIKNALRFYQSVGSIQAANIQLTTLLNASLRRVLGEVTFITVVRDEREALMARIRDQLDKEAAPRAARRHRRSGRKPIGRQPSSSPRPIRPPSRRAAPATPNATGCSPKPMARIRISSRSTAR